MMQDFAADIPSALVDADDILTRYGRWASNSGRSRSTCGSAEGNYRPPGGMALEARRDPSALPLDIEQRVAAQRALARVPDLERVVLSVLYVPRDRSIAFQLRTLGVPPRLAQSRHLAGLRCWWNLYGMQMRLTTV